ncbi:MULTISPECIES: hypothetical protein [unclassified Vibrio]|uniref:hypothetical protein n=1 Tax=unclassified Vibrio TaxID=2614977 RepID=UPI00136122CD|nr:MULTISPECIES: hypothetical protein [unclassified Vibrio]NAW57438.1 hypothetical protein [Vibrio sp. V36_P2S2PM302]NAX27125.1 hypothetical protein [Vibrio sp. V38_P2S17PM301]
MNDFIAQTEGDITHFVENWDNSVVLITAASLVAWLLWRLIYARLETLAAEKVA